MNQPRLDGVHHYKVPLSDLGESLQWYERVFGAERQAQFDHRSSARALYAYIVAVPGLGLLELRYAPNTAKAISGHDPVTYAVPTRADLRAWGPDAQGVALAAPYGHALIERGALGVVEVGHAAGGPGLLLEDNGVLDPGLVQDEVLAVGRQPLVDQVGHAAPRCGGRIRP